MSDAVKTARKARRIMLTVWAIAAVNFVAFVVAASYLGGDAINGKSEDGRFFLDNNQPGGPWEVDEIVFRYSQIHSVSVWLTHAAAFLTGLCAIPWLTDNQGKEIT